MRALPLHDGELLIAEHFLDAAAEAALLTDLQRDVPWRQKHITLFGRTVAQPRLTAWMGEPHAVYRYSGLTLTPLPWRDDVRALRDAVQAACDHPFDSVLLNLYRDGTDSMGLHSDDEPELGPAPVIASVSLGATRTFLLKHRRERTRALRLALPGGSLLLMRGQTQKNWRHGVPKDARCSAPRINLTFRSIVTRA